MTYRRSHFLVTAFSVISFLVFMSACQNAQEEKKETKPVVTIDNLQTAHSKAVRYSRMYSTFVKEAEKARNKNLAGLYKAVARSEEIRAANHAKLLRGAGVEPVMPPEEPIKIGTLAQTLKMATSSEEIQFDKMYPDLIRTAMLEKDTAAAEQFGWSRDVDVRHNDLFKQALDKGGKIPPLKYLVCPQCGYVFDSDKTDECPVCHVKKDKFESV